MQVDPGQSSPALTGSQRKFLRGRAHRLEPVVLVGQAGASDAVIAAVDQALLDHELIKVRLRVGDRDSREAALAALCAGTGAACAGRVGHVAILYRPHPEHPRLVVEG